MTKYSVIMAVASLGIIVILIGLNTGNRNDKAVMNSTKSPNNANRVNSEVLNKSDK